MKKKAKFSVLSLALATALTIPTVVSATDSGVTPTESTLPTATANQTIDNSLGLFAIGNNWSGNANSTSTSASSSFVVPKDYGHVKLYFHNIGKASVTITVTHIESNYTYVDAVSVASGAAYTWRSTTNYPQGMRSGSYTVSYHSSSGAVNVDYAGFASNSAAEANG
ncbi:hypothetical protein ACLBWT_12810 [Paenibacillus sp. D51F]